MYLDTYIVFGNFMSSDKSIDKKAASTSSAYTNPVVVRESEYISLSKARVITDMLPDVRLGTFTDALRVIGTDYRLDRLLDNREDVLCVSVEHLKKGTYERNPKTGKLIQVSEERFNAIRPELRVFVQDGGTGYPFIYWQVPHELAEKLFVKNIAENHPDIISALEERLKNTAMLMGGIGLEDVGVVLELIKTEKGLDALKKKFENVWIGYNEHYVRIGNDAKPKNEASLCTMRFWDCLLRNIRELSVDDDAISLETDRQAVDHAHFAFCVGLGNAEWREELLNGHFFWMRKHDKTCVKLRQADQ